MTVSGSLDFLLSQLSLLEYSETRTSLQLEAAILSEPSDLLWRSRDKNSLPSTLGGISALRLLVPYNITQSLYFARIPREVAENFGELLRSLALTSPDANQFSVVLS